MEDRFVKDVDLSFDNQLLADYEIEIRNEIKSLFDDIEKENSFFYSELKREEARFWLEFINKISLYIRKEEKFKRLSKIVLRYNNLCDFSERVSGILYDLEKIKSN